MKDSESMSDYFLNVSSTPCFKSGIDETLSLSEQKVRIELD